MQQKRKNIFIIFYIMQCLISTCPLYAELLDTVHSLSVEKDTELILPVYLDSTNSSGEIEDMQITIAFNSNIVSAVAARISNGFLSDYRIYERFQVSNQASVSIIGNGTNMQAGLVVEFILKLTEVGTSSVVLETLTCGDDNVSGGFLDNEYFRRIYVKSETFHIKPISDQVSIEDRPVDPIPFTVVIPGEVSGPIIREALFSNTQLISRTSINVKDSHHLLYIFLHANEYGTSTIDIHVKYNLHTGYNIKEASQSFDITILPVNDAPKFDMNASITIDETSGPQIFENWASNISPGANNEKDQTLTFNVSVDSPELFYTLPKIDSQTGDLQFFPADNVHGNALITVNLQDDGSTVNGGDRLSDRHDISFTINPFSPVISDNPVDRLIFITSNQPILPKKATPFIRIMASDANGDAVIMESDTHIFLQDESSDEHDGYFVNDQGNPKKSKMIIEIPAGEHSTMFKYFNDNPGKFPIKASVLGEPNWTDARITVQVKPEEPIRGDLNGNGKIDLQDVIQEIKVIAN